VKRILMSISSAATGRQCQIYGYSSVASRNKAGFWQAWLAALSALLVTGWVYRVAASRLELVTDRPVLLPVPLSTFPAEVNGWVGRQAAIPEHIRQAGGNDDFLHRVFVQKASGRWVSVYVGYTGRPRTMVGHRPQICYVASGWVHEASIQAHVLSLAGKTIPCSIHRFYKGDAEEQTVVLSYYVLNGQIISSESGFSGLMWRTPNTSGDPARYVAAVQISSALENSVRTAAADMTEVILDFLPDRNGKVKAAEYYSTAESGISQTD